MGTARSVPALAKLLAIPELSHSARYALESMPCPQAGAAMVELDRRRAIELAIREAAEGDAVLIAGKGHETYQESREGVIPFDDREVAREILEASKKT